MGGKHRQSKQIVAAVAELNPDFAVYAEPFCGSMSSATAVISAFPGRRYLLNDLHPALMVFWKACLDGWDPPETITEDVYNWYRETRPSDDPMTGYVGFVWSFGGKYYGGTARSFKPGKHPRSVHEEKCFHGSYPGTRRKIDILREADVSLSCGSYDEAPLGDLVYLDPPYAGRTKHLPGDFDHTEYCRFAEDVAQDAIVIATEFKNPRGWPVLHDYGDTVVRHHKAATKGDGTTELLLRVCST